MVRKFFSPRGLRREEEISGSTSYDVDRAVRNDLQQRKRGQHAVNSALRETDSKAEPVHGSAKQGVVAVRSPSGSSPEGTSSGRALFLFAVCPARRPRHIARSRRRGVVNRWSIRVVIGRRREAASVQLDEVGAGLTIRSFAPSGGSTTRSLLPPTRTTGRFT